MKYPMLRGVRLNISLFYRVTPLDNVWDVEELVESPPPIFPGRVFLTSGPLESWSHFYLYHLWNTLTMYNPMMDNSYVHTSLSTDSRSNIFLRIFVKRNVSFVTIPQLHPKIQVDCSIDKRNTPVIVYLIPSNI